nr:hypothetical protein [Tanacetum cinerariifolium]
MSSSDSTVTYTSVSSEDVPFWGIRFFGMKRPDSPETALQSPIQTPPVPQDEDDREPMFIQPHDLNYVPGPMYPEYIPLEEEHVLLAEEQPLPPVVSPTAESPEDDDDGDSSGNDADDEDEDKEEEEHLAPADFAIVIPIDELVSPPERTEHVMPPPSTDTTTTRVRITVRLQAVISFPPEAEVERLLTMPTPSPSPLTSLSPPSVGERPTRESSTARTTEDRGIDYRFIRTLDAKVRRRGIKERVDLLMEDRIAHQETIQIVEEEAYAAREAWAHSIRLSQAVYSELQTHREQVYAHDFQLQAELLALREQPRRARQLGGDARVPDHQDAPRDADNYIYGFMLFNFTRPLYRHAKYYGIIPASIALDLLYVFQISGCVIENQVKFVTYTLLDAALTWWNSQIRSLGPDAYSMTWEVKGNDVLAYTKRFQELTMICTKFVANETEKIDKYVSGLPDNIYGSVKASKPKTLDETIELANDLMDQKLRTYTERRMIPELGDPNREVPVNETFHVQTDDELTKKKLKQIEADDQAIQTILLGLLEDICAAVDSCETAQEIWLRVHQLIKGSDIGLQEK